MNITNKDYYKAKAMQALISTHRDKDINKLLDNHLNNKSKGLIRWIVRICVISEMFADEMVDEIYSK